MRAGRDGETGRGPLRGGRLGASQFGVWLIKHVVAPVHGWLYRVTGGRGVRYGRLARTLMLTTTGRRTGRLSTTPLFYLRSGDHYIVCNVRPVGEPVNPWVVNLRAIPTATVQLGPNVLRCRAREVVGPEVDSYWPRFVDLWPAYERLFRRSGQRCMFVLDPISSSATDVDG